MALKYSTGLRNFLLGEGSLRKAFEDGQLLIYSGAAPANADDAPLGVLLAKITIPFLDDLLDEWEKFFGTPVRSNMRKTLREAGGPVLEKMGMAGIPALMGIDISGSLKIGIPLAGSGTPQDTIYGVYGGLARKSLNAMSAVEREDYLRAMEFASPAFIEAVLKAFRMSDTGVTTPRGKVITDEQGKPIRLGAGEGIAQAAGFRPERLARISGEHWTMENVQKHFKEKRDDLYSRYRLARTPEEKHRVIRDMQKFNMEARKYRGVIPPITATSMGQATQPKAGKTVCWFWEDDGSRNSIIKMRHQAHDSKHIAGVHMVHPYSLETNLISIILEREKMIGEILIWLQKREENH